MSREILFGLLIPFFGTTSGAAMVFVLRSELSRSSRKVLTGFAAGVMIYVVIEELIPEMSEGGHTNVGTVAFAIGFSLMMALDVALGS